MDLKNVVKEVHEDADEAELAYHAGHRDRANNRLLDIFQKIRTHFNEMKPGEAEAMQAVTNESEEQKAPETPVEDPTSKAQPASTARTFLGENVGQTIQSEKPNQ